MKPYPEGRDERPDIPLRVKRWPDRVRCYECRNFLTFIVVDRLYCSWHCAGRAPEPPPTDPLNPQGAPTADVPRQCTLAKRKRYKRRYATLGEARRAAKVTMEPGIVAYACDHCGFFHIGHRMTDEIEKLKKQIEVLAKENKRLRQSLERKYDKDRRALQENSAEWAKGIKEKRDRVTQGRKIRKEINGKKGLRGDWRKLTSS